MKTTRIVLAGIGLATLASASFPTDPGKEPNWLDLDGIGYEEPLANENEESASILGSLKTIYADNDITVSWGGRIMIDWGWFDEDDSYPVSGDDGTEIRRARLFSKGTLFETVDWKLQLDFAGGDADFADAYLRWQSGWGDVLVGHFKEPMGLEELTSSRFITFMERSMMTEALIPGRNSGIMLTDTIGANTNWALFFGRETDDFASDRGEGDYVYTARIAHWIETGAEGDGIHIGGGVSLRNSQNDKLTRTRPEAHLLGRTISSGLSSTDGSLYYNLSTAWVLGPLSIQAEYTGGTVDEWSASTTGSDVDIMGYYVQASYFLTGERRPHKASRGTFDRVKPRANWDGKSLKGAWEVALRYSAIDFDDGDFANAAAGGNLGAESAAITLGLNYYLNPHTRIMLNVLQNTYEDDLLDEDLTAAMMRFQVDW